MSMGAGWVIVPGMELEERLEEIQREIGRACERSRRAREEVLLLPVTKGHPAEVVARLDGLGFRVFGESKVQEAKAKISNTPGRCRWHMIGHLQSNKCRDAARLFAMVESVDSVGLAEELQKCCEREGRTLPILLEVNVAGESTKYGFSPAAALEAIEPINKLDRLELHGLMAIAPYSPNPERSRPYFARLRELRGEAEKILGAPLPQLSMGMSGDYAVAIEEGATIVRIGTALLGERVSVARPAE